MNKISINVTFLAILIVGSNSALAVDVNQEILFSESTIWYGIKIYEEFTAIPSQNKHETLIHTETQFSITITDTNFDANLVNIDITWENNSIQSEKNQLDQWGSMLVYGDCNRKLGFGMNKGFMFVN